MIPGTSIAELLPHAGAMVLVDEIVYADPMRIECITRAHERASFPLAVGGRVSALCGIELAAQAMALHGGVNDPRHRRRSGRLAAVSEVELLHDRLDDRPGALRIEVELEHDSARASAYRFVVASGTETLVRGRALLVRTESR